MKSMLGINILCFLFCCKIIWIQVTKKVDELESLINWSDNAAFFKETSAFMDGDEVDNETSSAIKTQIRKMLKVLGM